MKRIFSALSSGTCGDIDHFASMVEESVDDSLHIDCKTKNEEFERRLNKNSCENCLEKKKKETGETFAKSMICHKCDDISEGNLLCLKCSEEYSLCVICKKSNVEKNYEADSEEEE